MHPARSGIVAACVAASVLGSSGAAAQSIIKDPNPPRYAVEVEPKLNLNPSAFYSYGGTGVGPGVRVSIPLVRPGFIPTINNSVAISFGLDLMRYSGYSYYGRCDAVRCYGYDPGSFWSLDFPVAMQWNFWLTDRWSVFGEPGLAFRHAFYSDAYCDRRYYSCGSRDDFYLALFAGGRFKFNDSIALTMRIGHPVLFSAGISIFL